MAICQLLLLFFTCSIGVLLWPIIDGIMLLRAGGTDSNGRRLRDRPSAE